MFRFLKFYGVIVVVSIFIYTFLDFYNEELAEDIPLIATMPDIMLKEYSGELKSITSFDSEIVLVDFWFSQCAPCIEQMKYFPELLEKYRGRLSIISYSIDPPKTTQDVLLSRDKKWSFLKEEDPDWYFFNEQKLGNQQSLRQLFNVQQYPTYIIFNKNGEILSQPYNGVYGIEKYLGGTFTLKLTFKKYFSKFDISKLIIPLFFAFVATLVILLISFIKRKYLNHNNIE